MEEPLAIPASISYRQLQALAQSAPADAAPLDGTSGCEPTALDSALEAWSLASQQLLATLQQAGPALGALQAHVAMGLQALASSRRPQG
jgi:hypothetical protein